jgi:hypothetical protein
MGVSWAVYLLPYIEQNAAFQKLNPTLQDYGWWQKGNVGTVGRDFQKFYPSVFICPSNPVPVTDYRGLYLQNSYAGISGANIEAPGYGQVKISGFAGLQTGTNMAYRGASTQSFGNMALNGVLIPNARLTLSVVTDGTTNVMVLGEQSDWGVATNPGANGAGAPYVNGNLYPCRASGHQVHWGGPAAWTGLKPVNIATKTIAPNLTTITAGLGTRICPDPNGQWYGNHIETEWPNTPIRSAHTGGSWILFADGGVRFLQEGINTTLFKYLAIRDCGVVKSLTD